MDFLKNLNTICSINAQVLTEKDNYYKQITELMSWRILEIL